MLVLDAAVVGAAMVVDAGAPPPGRVSLFAAGREHAGQEQDDQQPGRRTKGWARFDVASTPQS